MMRRETEAAAAGRGGIFTRWHRTFKEMHIQIAAPAGTSKSRSALPSQDGLPVFPESVPVWTKLPS